MKTPEIDLQTGELVIYQHGLQWSEDLDHIAQNLRAVLKFVAGEWFLDSTLGVRYFETAFLKNPDLSKVSALIKTAIAGAYGIREILAFEMAFNNTERKVTVTTTVDTILGNLTITESLA